MLRQYFFALGKRGWEESQYKHNINHQVFPFFSSEYFKQQWNINKNSVFSTHSNNGWTINCFLIHHRDNMQLVIWQLPSKQVEARFLLPSLSHKSVCWAEGAKWLPQDHEKGLIQTPFEAMKSVALTSSGDLEKTLSQSVEKQKHICWCLQRLSPRLNHHFLLFGRGKGIVGGTVTKAKNMTGYSI